MSNDTIITILVFLSINVVIYVALLRWASRINNIEENLKSIDVKLDMLIEAVVKFQGREAGIIMEDHSSKDLH